MTQPVPVLLIGRKGSRGVPGKNTMPMLGRPMMQYPLMAAYNSRHVGEVFVSTDCDDIKRIARAERARIIDRPAELASNDALVEDVVVHGYETMRAALGEVPIFVLLFCNSATIRPGLIDEGLEALRADPTADSAVSVSLYNEYSPVRAMKINDAGLIESYVDVDTIPNASCDRDTADPAYFCDCSAWVLRDRCTDLSRGRIPFRWIGQRSLPIFQEGGVDIDYFYGVGHTEAWLRRHGFSETATPYDAPAYAEHG